MITLSISNTIFDSTLHLPVCTCTTNPNNKIMCHPDFNKLSTISRATINEDGCPQLRRPKRETFHLMLMSDEKLGRQKAAGVISQSN